LTEKEYEEITRNLQKDPNYLLRLDLKNYSKDLEEKLNHENFASEVIQHFEQKFQINPNCFLF
jgi:hypothetical protein